MSSSIMDIQRPEFKQTISSYKQRLNNQRKLTLDMKYAIPIPMKSSIHALNFAISFAINREDQIANQQKPYDRITPDLFKFHVQNIFEQMGQPKDMREASIKTYLSKIQEFIEMTNAQNPKRNAHERIFYFEERPRQKKHRVFYRKFEPKFNRNLFIYKDLSGQFYVLTNVGKFFNSKNKQKYCVECNSWYEQLIKNRHNKKCPIRCQACYRINPKDGPCLEIKKVPCNNCYKV